MGPSGCSGSVADSNTAKTRWRVAASYGQFWSHLRFDGDIEPTLNQHTVVGTASVIFGRRFDMSLSGGGILGGQLYDSRLLYEIVPGWLVSFQFGVRVLEEKKARPFMRLFVATSFSMSHLKNTVGNTHKGEEKFVASDVRLGIAVGYTLLENWQVYIAPKIFGGPVFWTHEGETIQGRDRYFFQAGVGSTVVLPAGLSVFVEGSAFGEQMISAGLAWDF